MKIRSVVITMVLLSVMFVPLMSMMEHAEADTPTNFAQVYTDISDDAIFEYFPGNETYMVKSPRGLYVTTSSDPATYDASYVKSSEIDTTEEGTTLLFGNDDETFNMYHYGVRWVDATKTSKITVSDGNPITDKFYTRFGYGNYYLFDGVDFINWAGSTSANGGDIHIRNATATATTSNGIYLASVSPGKYFFENMQFGNTMLTKPNYGFRTSYVDATLINCTFDYNAGSYQVTSWDSTINWIGGDIIHMDTIRAEREGHVYLWYRADIQEIDGTDGQLIVNSQVDETLFDMKIGEGYINLPYGHSYNYVGTELSNDASPLRYSIVPPAGKVVDSVTIDDVEMEVTDNVFYYNNVLKDPSIVITYKDYIPYPVEVNMSLPSEGDWYSTNTNIPVSAVGSEGDYYLWEWAEGTLNTTSQTATISYTTPVNDTEVKLTVMHGYDYYSENTSVNINVQYQPYANISSPLDETILMHNSSKVFNSSGSIGKLHNWSWGDGNYTVTEGAWAENVTFTDDEDFDSGTHDRTFSDNDRLLRDVEEGFFYIDDPCDDLEGTDTSSPTVDPPWTLNGFSQDANEHAEDHDDNASVPEGQICLYSHAQSNMGQLLTTPSLVPDAINMTMEMTMMINQSAKGWSSYDFASWYIVRYLDGVTPVIRFVPEIGSTKYDVWYRTTDLSYQDSGLDIHMPYKEYFDFRVAIEENGANSVASFFIDGVFQGSISENWWVHTAVSDTVYIGIVSGTSGTNEMFLDTIRWATEPYLYYEQANWSTNASSYKHHTQPISDITITSDTGDASNNYSVHITDSDGNRISNSTANYQSSTTLFTGDFDNGLELTDDEVEVEVQINGDGYTTFSIYDVNINTTETFPDEEVSHTYTVEGDYQVNLTVGDPRVPETHTSSINVTVLPPVPEILPPEPIVINVDTSEQFDTIQKAINDTDTLDGHTLRVYEGQYEMEWQWSVRWGDVVEALVINKSLTIIGNGTADTQITATDGYIYIQSDNVTFTDVEIEGAVIYCGYLHNGISGIIPPYPDSGTDISENSTIENILSNSNAFLADTYANNCDFVYMDGYTGSDPTIISNSEFNTWANEPQGNMYVDNSTVTHFYGKRIDNSTVGNVDCDYIKSCTISGTVQTQDNLEVYLSTFTGSGIGLDFDEQNNTGVTISGNTFESTITYGVYGLLSSSTIYNNDFNCIFYGVYLVGTSEWVEAVPFPPAPAHWENESSTDNLVYYNNFNTCGAYDNGTDNRWNETEANGGGNHWYNWTSPDSNGDGFVDNPYPYIEGESGSLDYLPLSGVVSVPLSVQLDIFKMQLFSLMMFLLTLLILLILFKKIKKMLKDSRGAMK